MLHSSLRGFDFTGMAVAIFGEDDGVENYLLLESKKINDCLYLLAEEMAFEKPVKSNHITEKFIFKFACNENSVEDLIRFDKSHRDYAKVSRIFGSASVL